MVLFKTDRPRTIDQLIDYFGESRQVITAPLDAERELAAA
jgi:hypothetical protein